MAQRIAACLVLLLIACAPAQGAELFYMDHDPFTNKYLGPSGPLVFSGDIDRGDYDRLLAKIAEDENRFLEQGKLLLASDGGDVTEAIKIARLVKALSAEVIVGPVTGRCAGVCFLIYAAADQRGTDGRNLIGMYRPQLDDADAAQLPAPDAAILEDSIQADARAFVQENAVPDYLIDEMFRHSARDVYWLSERDEQNLGAKSPSFEKFLAAKCAWSDTLERSVYKGERPIEELKQVWVCRARLTQPAARQALDSALHQSNTTRGK
ncbi:MAG: hypothetical protein ACLPUH_05250 [Steroidobacteraceae bacterium]